MKKHITIGLALLMVTCLVGLSFAGSSGLSNPVNKFTTLALGHDNGIVNKTKE